MDPDITIILPTFDRRHVLERTLWSYQRLSHTYTVLVVDDGSHDGTAEWVRSQGLDVIRHPRRLGLPAARNAGLRLARTPWILFGEDDVMFPPEHPRILLQEARRLPRVAAIAGISHTWDGWEMPAEAPAGSSGPALDFTRMLADFAYRPAHAVTAPTLHSRSLIRRDLALSVGGYDESLFDSAFREDSDFFARLWSTGSACWITPKAWELHVRHRLGGGCRGARGAIPKLMNRWSYWRNNARFVDRHWRLWHRWGSVPHPGRQKAAYAWALMRQALDQYLGGR